MTNSSPTHDGLEICGGLHYIQLRSEEAVSRPLVSLCNDIDPELECPALPGRCYFKGNAKWYEPHALSSGLRAKPLPRSGWLILPDSTGWLGAAALALKTLSFPFIV